MFIIYENLSSLTAYIIWILLISNRNLVSLNTALASLNCSTIIYCCANYFTIYCQVAKSLFWVCCLMVPGHYLLRILNQLCDFVSALVGLSQFCENLWQLVKQGSLRVFRGIIKGSHCPGSLLSLSKCIVFHFKIFNNT